MELSSFRKGGHLHNVLEGQQEQREQPSNTIVVLKNFQFIPNKIQAKINTGITIKVEENKRGFSEIYQSKGFIFSIQQLEIQSTSLLSKSEWTFQIPQQGKFQLICLNYCKLSLEITIVSQQPERQLIHIPEQSIEQNSGNKIKQIINVKDRFESFTYQQFQNLICSQQLTKFDEIPQYLLRCFQTELNILQKTKINQSSDLTPNLSSITKCRDHSTNTQQCSGIQQFDQSRKTMDSPGKSKALAIFQDEQSGELKARALKKTSSQVINLQWKQQSINESKKQPSETFEQQVQSFLQTASNRNQVFIPSNKHTINNILTLLQNRMSILEYIV